MSCCGNRYSGQHARSIASGAPSYAPVGASSDPVFEYVGASSLTITGPLSGRTYRFEGRGSRLPVNRHDAPSLLYIPNLRSIAQR